MRHQKTRLGILAGRGLHRPVQRLDPQLQPIQQLEKIGTPLSIARAFELVRSGQLAADAQIDRTIEFLAIGIAAIVNIFNPAAVLVQARMFDVRAGIFEQLLELVQRRALNPTLADCRIMRASGSKLQSAVAGIIHHLTSVLGPRM